MVLMRTCECFENEGRRLLLVIRRRLQHLLIHISHDGRGRTEDQSRERRGRGRWSRERSKKDRERREER